MKKWVTPQVEEFSVDALGGGISLFGDCGYRVCGQSFIQKNAGYCGGFSQAAS